MTSHAATPPQNCFSHNQVLRRGVLDTCAAVHSSTVTSKPSLCHKLATLPCSHTQKHAVSNTLAPAGHLRPGPLPHGAASLTESACCCAAFQSWLQHLACQDPARSAPPLVHPPRGVVAWHSQSNIFSHRATMHTMLPNNNQRHHQCPALSQAVGPHRPCPAASQL